MNFDIGRLALVAAQRLVNHHARIRQAETFTFCPCSQQESTHRGRLAHTDGADIRLDKLHGVIDRHPGSNHPAWRVNVQIDIFFWVFCFQEQHLRHNQVSHVIFNLASQKNDAFLK